LRTNLNQDVLQQIMRKCKPDLARVTVCRRARELVQFLAGGRLEVSNVEAAQKDQFGADQPQQV
jgi:hypothetical protein